MTLTLAHNSGVILFPFSKCPPQPTAHKMQSSQFRISQGYNVCNNFLPPLLPPHRTLLTPPTFGGTALLAFNSLHLCLQVISLPYNIKTTYMNETSHPKPPLKKPTNIYASGVSKRGKQTQNSEKNKYKAHWLCRATKDYKGAPIVAQW